MSAASPETPETSERIARMTREQCAEWAENPMTNPFTGRAIDPAKPIYRAIAERCATFGLAPPNGDRIGRYPTPNTSEEWANTVYRSELLGHYAASRHFGYLVENTIPLKTLNAVAVACLLRGVVPEAERKLVARIVRHNARLLKTPGAVRPHSAARMEIAKTYGELVRQDVRLLLNGRPRRNAVTRADLEALMYTAFFLGQQLNDAPRMARSVQNYEDALDLLVATEALEHDLVLARAPTDHDDALPESRERSLPESISRRRVKQRKRKARADDPDEYYPWSATEEAAPTDRSRFRSHAKMSVMSPGPADADGAALPPLTPKKRTAMLAELREACTVMKDLISMQRFDRMNKKALQLVVRLGPKGAGGQQRCYYVKNLYQLWTTAEKSGQPFRDPLTRAAVTDAEKDAILRLARRVRPSAPDPRAYRLPRDPKLQLEVQQVWASRSDLASPRGSPSGSDSPGEAVGVYHLTVARPVGKVTFVIGDLGYMPSDVQLADVGGDANLTSAAVIANLRALFDRGRLMESNVPPYDCCRVHLHKPMDHWIAKRSRGSPASPAGAGGIHLLRWKAFATEVYGAL